MDAVPRGSVTHWLHGLHAGDSVAAQELWNRFFSRLVAIAHSRLKTLARESTGEDVALSALKSVMLGIQANRFPDLTDRTGLWPLLVTITARKAITEMRRQLAAKRSANAEQALPDLDLFIGDQPTPEFAVEVADELERLVRRFDDPTVRTIAQRKLEGFTNNEIADELRVSIRTVIRKLNLIRQEWDEDEEEEI